MFRHTPLPVRPAPPLCRFQRITHPTPRPLDRSNGLLNVLIGLPGAGKTSFCAAAADQLGTRLSLDAARARYGTGPEDQSVTQQAVAHVVGEAERLLHEHQQVTIDATSTTVAERATWLSVAAAADVPAIAYWITTPAKVALQRNAARARQVPGEVIADKAHCLAGLTVGGLYVEGFAAVCEVRTVPSSRTRGIRKP